ncbi:MAG: DMT family transporter [Treponema sp.]|jgi:drug/metabolite transporter (DMT)-like permease|nr:DMT family transporter [Treponema sp.]
MRRREGAGVFRKGLLAIKEETLDGDSPFGMMEGMKYIRTGSPQTFGQGAIFLCAILWSTSGLCIKLVPWHPVLIAGARSGIAALFLWGMRLLFMRRKGRASKPLPVFAAGLAYAATMITFVVANKLTTSANAILLQYSAPLWAAILGWVLIKEKLSWKHWGGLGLVIVGLVVFFKDSLGGGTLSGDCLALLSGVFFGTTSVCMRMQKEGNPADAMLLSHILCAGFAVPFAFLYPPVLSRGSMGAMLFMGTLQIGCASLLYAYGIKRVSAIQAMLTAVIEPVLNPLWVLLVTGEQPSSAALFGGGLILGGVLISSLSPPARQRV